MQSYAIRIRQTHAMRSSRLRPLLLRPLERCWSLLGSTRRSANCRARPAICGLLKMETSFDGLVANVLRFFSRTKRLVGSSHHQLFLFVSMMCAAQLNATHPFANRHEINCKTHKNLPDGMKTGETRWQQEVLELVDFLPTRATWVAHHADHPPMARQPANLSWGSDGVYSI